MTTRNWRLPDDGTSQLPVVTISHAIHEMPQGTLALVTIGHATQEIAHSKLSSADCHARDTGDSFQQACVNYNQSCDVQESLEQSCAGDSLW